MNSDSYSSPVDLGGGNVSSATTQSNGTTNVQASSVDKSLFDFGEGDIDVALNYECELVKFRASSHALCFASPVWKKFIYPPFPKITDEGNGNSSNTQIDFTEDNGKALLILLNIAHLQFNKVPSELPFETLLQVAVLCDQYDCVSLVGPWLKQWIIDELRVSRRPGQEAWLFIAWAFGRNKVFETLASNLAAEVYINFEGQYMTSMGKSLDIMVLPPDILGSTIGLRHETIGKLLALPYDFLKRFESYNDPVCQQSSMAMECDAITYGSLLLGLQRANLWPQKKPEDVQDSVKNLKQKILVLQTLFWTKRGEHEACGIRGFKARLVTELSDINPTLDYHRRHMEGVAAALSVCS